MVPPSMNSIEREDTDGEFHHSSNLSNISHLSLCLNLFWITHQIYQSFHFSAPVRICFDLKLLWNLIPAASWLRAMNFTIREERYSNPLSHSVLSPPNTISNNFNIRVCSLSNGNKQSFGTVLESRRSGLNEWLLLPRPVECVSLSWFCSQKGERKIKSSRKVYKLPENVKEKINK